MDEGLSRGHVETFGCDHGGGHGGAVVLFAKVGFGKRDDLFNCQGISSAFYHWVCSAIHFQSGK